MFQVTISAGSLVEMMEKVVSIPVDVARFAQFSIAGDISNFSGFMQAVHSAAKWNGLIVLQSFNDGNLIWEETYNFDSRLYYHTMITGDNSISFDSLDEQTKERIKEAIVRYNIADRLARRTYARLLLSTWGISN